MKIQKIKALLCLLAVFCLLPETSFADDGLFSTRIAGDADGSGGSLFADSVLPAFPGAVGMGAYSVGGRGGDVYIVDTLSDNPDDGLTFREAVEALGPRTVVFAVSGNIVLQGRLWITNPFLTIAGETSPGGIAVVGERVTLRNIHDVIIRHVRFRVGYSNAGNSDAEMDAFQIWGDSSRYNSLDPQYHSYNIIVDHCSFSFGIDENVETAYTVYDITFSHNLNSFALKNPPTVNAPGAEGGMHNLGGLHWGKYAAVIPRITFFANYYSSLTSRMPQTNYDGFVDMRNNVAYNFFGGSTPGFYVVDSLTYSMKGNFVNNYTLGGPQSNATYGVISGSLENGAASMYFTGNTGCNIDGGTSEWCVGRDWQQYLLDISIKSPVPFSTTGIPVTSSPLSTKELATAVVQNAGATVPVRDSLDARAVNDFVNETDGTWNGGVTYPDDFPVLQNILPPLDTDGDGMSDAWEIASFGDISRLHNGDEDNDGYTNLEEYLHCLVGDCAVSTGSLFADGFESL
jgi:pectate lyase